MDPHSVDRSVQDDDDDDDGGGITSLFPVWLHRLQVAAVRHSEHLFVFERSAESNIVTFYMRMT